MSIEWMVALAVFAGVGLLWYSQRADAPYRRDRDAPPGDVDEGHRSHAARADAVSGEHAD